ncbi:DUF2577 domain-containing protein [Paenibacillus naphthalenovorans]|uniref:DUF2577 domain-containing protein n=1 Tax=Paenibacillus naphthalenovorans TaxID=162209 RepID=UPI00087F2E84|nr:DUF2577 domain-containing protein [Paenibacillus naphthalenovorans]SDJ76219.1 Protein of unknown function [Paenibacillus naphthalenovorans]
MLNAIRQAALSAMEAGNPVAVMYGEVTKTNPLEVNVDQRFTLDADFLIVPESLTRLEIDLRHSHIMTSGTAEEALTQPIVIRPGLQAGDHVVLLRMQGGQKYLILDKVVSA